MWVQVYGSYVGSAVATNLFFFFFFFFIFFLLGSVNGGSLSVEWELSESFLGEMSLALMVDWVTCLFVMSVLFISTCVYIFSGFYMGHEVFMKRFISLVQIFVMYMLILVLFPSYMSLMIGWDGLGVVSFLLVVFYMNSESLSAGMITALSNRVGDVMFILGIGMMSCLLSYSAWGENMLEAGCVGMLLVGGSITKSAQVPFSGWLPEAMAAPTPVSTLVHSSTLVTGGVYVLFRLESYLGEAEKSILMFLSMVTMLLASSSACVEVDMKKVVALSTLSQVGVMMFSLSLGANLVAFFHLLVHAFIKALMFMCVGGIIYYSGGFQDARHLGGAYDKLPLTCCLLIFSSFSLMGFPFLSGFYSKELIVSSYLMMNCGCVGFGLLFSSLSMTIMYSFRVMYLLLSGSGGSSLSHYSMENGYYVICLTAMSSGSVVMSIFMQSCLKKFLIPMSVKSESVFEWLLSVVSLFLMLCLLLGLGKSVEASGKLKDFLCSMWFLKHLSGNILSSNFLVLVSNFVSCVEMGWIRGYLWGKGLQELAMSASNKVRKMNYNMMGVVMFFSLCIMVLVLV